MKSKKDKKFIDISMSINSNAMVYPGDDALDISPLCTISHECPCNITKLGLTTHFLTHVDPPLHFVPNGASLDDIPLERFYGECLVVKVDGDYVSSEHFPLDISLKGKNILFKTANSIHYDSVQFNEDHVYLSKSGAEMAVKLGVNLVGIDYISIDKYGDSEYPAHKTLLGNNILILEGVDLSNVSEGWYELYSLPLKIEKGDGSPVRAILLPIAK